MCEDKWDASNFREFLGILKLKKYPPITREDILTIVDEYFPLILEPSPVDDLQDVKITVTGSLDDCSPTSDDIEQIIALPLGTHVRIREYINISGKLVKCLYGNHEAIVCGRRSSHYILDVQGAMKGGSQAQTELLREDLEVII